MGTPRKLYAILLNIKINPRKLVDMCRYKVATYRQNFMNIFLTWVKIVKKVLGGLLFWLTLYILPFWLEIAYSPHFWGFGGIFSPNDVTHHPNPQKALPYAKTRRLSHKAWKSVQRFDLGAFPRKNGQDRTGQDKTVKVVIFRLFGEKPPLHRLKPNLAWWVISPK